MEYIQDNDTNLGLDYTKNGSSWTVKLKIIPKNNGGMVYQGCSKDEGLREAIISASRQAFGIPESINVVEEYYCDKFRCLCYRYTAEATGEYPERIALAYSKIFCFLHKQMQTKTTAIKATIML